MSKDPVMMEAKIDPAIEHLTLRGVDDERVRTDTASVVERKDGSLLVAYHSYSPGPEGGGDFGAAKVYLADSVDDGRTWSEREDDGGYCPRGSQRDEPVSLLVGRDPPAGLCAQSCTR